MKTSSKSRLEYQSRINRVMDYVESHLKEELSLEKLAKVARFSPFHFHRIFSSMTGETLNDFLRRMRLERSIHLLRFHLDSDITQIAFDCGFNSSSSFARSFKSYFGVSASEFRDGGFGKIRQTKSKNCKANSKNRKALSRQYLHNSSLETSNSKEKKMNVTIEKLPSFHVAYSRHIGAYDSKLIDFWEKFWEWAGARDLVNKDSIWLGISHDDPKVTPAEKCRYDACIVVPESFKAERGITLQDITGGKYAVYKFKGTNAEIIRDWTNLYSKWLPDSGFVPDERPCFELYRGESSYDDCEKGIFHCDLCIPVKPL